MSEEFVRPKTPNTVALFYRSVLGWTVAVLVGIAAVFPARFFGFPNMLAAQTAVGVFGFTGGFTHALVMKGAGGKVSWGHGLLLSIVWALSCIGGVTPLFLALGTAPKIVVLAFYCFAVSGALGGAATALVGRTLFDNAASRDVVPSMVIWSFTFGVAAVASDIVGEGLQQLFPAWISWSISVGMMAMIIGAGGAYSLVQLLGAEEKGKRGLERCRVGYGAFSDGENKRYILVLILLTLPFYLNDFSNIYVKDWRLWIFIDYATVKLYPLLVVLWLISRKKMLPSEFGLTAQPVSSFAAVFLIGTLAGILIDQNGYILLERLPGYRPLGGMPEIKSPGWRGMDLTFGLLMVGIFEELVFRGYLHTFLSRTTQSTLLIVGISAVAFGFIHWSWGFHRVLVTSTTGAVFMALYVRTRSTPAIMLAHFAVNFISFGEVIPKSIFRFPGLFL